MKGSLFEIFAQKLDPHQQWLSWDNKEFVLLSKKPKHRRHNRETLARIYDACICELNKKKIPFEHASSLVRAFWSEEVDFKLSKNLPQIINEDGFLRMYALGSPCSAALVKRIWNRIHEPIENRPITHEPLYVEWNERGNHFYDVDATPQGILCKIFPYFRIKKDEELLLQIASDLERISKISDSYKRTWLTLAVLSHGAAYREIDGYRLFIPSFKEEGKLVPYQCTQYLIAEGLKTISLTPLEEGHSGIYLCQGTEFWPSQPSMLGSILANFGEHGSATEAYAHSWRRIHKHLRDLPGTPLVAGHSMGGALAIQIGLYSHNLIDKAFSYNPPMPNERDYNFYGQLSDESKQKIQVIANLDDFAFWRIGSKIVGNVTLFLGKIRWKYYSITLWDCIFLLPAFLKFMRNVHHAFPAHQSIAALYENWVRFKLTPNEIEKENSERVRRFDYLHFLPKLYDPLKVLMTHVRKIFKWRLEEEYLRNEIEILALHERDLLDTLSEGKKEEIEHELAILHRQKDEVLNKLQKKTHSRF